MVRQCSPRCSFDCCQARPLKGYFGQLIEFGNNRFKIGSVSLKVGESPRVQRPRCKLGGFTLKTLYLKLLIASISAETKQAHRQSGQHANFLVQMLSERAFLLFSEIAVANRTDLIRYKRGELRERGTQTA
jgi:hypothetical protein